MNQLLEATTTSNLKMWVSNPWNLLESCGHPTSRKDDLNFGAAADVVGVSCGRGLRRLNSEIPRENPSTSECFISVQRPEAPQPHPTFLLLCPTSQADVHTGIMDQSSTGVTNTQQKHLVDRALLPADQKVLTETITKRMQENKHGK